MYLDDILVGATLMRLAVLSVLEEYAIHVGTRVLEQLVGTGEQYESDLDVAQYAQFVGLLHQTELPLRERHLTTSRINSRFLIVIQQYYDSLFKHLQCWHSYHMT